MPVDKSELDQLIRDLERAPQLLPKHLRKALERTARGVKDAARAKVRKRSRPWRQAASSIDYELEGSSGTVSTMSADVGYNKDTPAGNLGNLLEFGAPRAKKHVLVKRKGKKTKSIPVPGDVAQPLAPGGELQAALQEHEEDFERGVDAAVDDAMREVDL